MNSRNEMEMAAKLPQVGQGNYSQTRICPTDLAVKSNIVLNEYYNKNCIDLEYQRNKRMLDIAYDCRLLENRYCHAQKVKEGKLAHCEVVEINNNGEIQIVSKNMTIPSKPRLVVNFKYEDAITYISTDSNEKIVQLLLKLDVTTEKRESVFLALKDLTKNRYIEKKFLNVGVSVYGSSESKKREYMKMIVAYLICKSTQTVMVPMKRGWYRNADRIEFFDGQWTWEELVKNAE